MFIMKFSSTVIFFLLLCLNFTVHSGQQVLPIQHSVIANKDIEVSQYWISEKLDGVRGYWDGSQLWTRQGNKINAPKWFTQGWSNIPFDGELWSDRDKFQQIVSCVKRKKIKPNCWHDLRLMIFDLPTSKEKFSNRITAMNKLIADIDSPHLAVIKQFRISSNNALYQKLEQIVLAKGEGLMLHHQDAFYQAGRNKRLMKLKKYQDDEAVVIKHINGKGKYKNMLGSLLVQTKDGLQFKIGTGFSDKQRKSPPPIGTIITYKYVGKTQRGVPRFASFIRIRE